MSSLCYSMDCSHHQDPDSVCPTAIINARAVAINRGDGTAFARAVGVGVVHGGDSAIAFSEAVSILLKNEGCEKLKPTLLGK